MNIMKTTLIGLFILVVAVLSYKTIETTLTRNALRGEFHGKIVWAPLDTFGNDGMPKYQNVLGDTAGKRIEVNLASQSVLAFEGSNKVNEFVVSTGLWGRTPTGSFTIQRKVASQTMAGGNRALGTYYYLPGVPWVQFFGNAQIPWSRGFSFHGTYWHNNFGHPMSHGCINMKTPDAKWLYDWAPMGTPVQIYGNTPAS
jgi:lipoprotein-anchoring transpeptidase ErfK/SrfK